MKTTIKKICLILALILSPALCAGAETLNINLGSNYLITTEKSIKTNAVENPAILTINPFFNIFNDKNILLVHPEKLGSTKVTLFIDNSCVVFNINVKPQNTPTTFSCCENNGVEFSLLDQPPIIENLEIITPSIEIEENK